MLLVCLPEEPLLSAAGDSADDAGVHAREGSTNSAINAAAAPVF
jgi:hypothetical protein